MPDVTWTKDATTVTLDKGNIRGAHQFDRARVVTDRLAGGAIVAYELGLTPLEVLACEFPHVSKTKLDDLLNFKNAVVKDDLLTFTHTDNSESPALVKTVRLASFEYAPEAYTNPAVPRHRVRATLQVEPS